MINNLELTAAILGIVSFFWMLADSIRTASLSRIVRNLTCFAVMGAVALWTIRRDWTPERWKHPGTLTIEEDGDIYRWTEVRDGANHQVEERREDGIVRMRLKIVNGLLDGEQEYNAKTSFDINQTSDEYYVTHIALFRKGIRHGDSTCTYDNGQVMFRITFHNGIPTPDPYSFRVFDRFGKPYLLKVRKEIPKHAAFYRSDLYNRTDASAFEHETSYTRRVLPY